MLGFIGKWASSKGMGRVPDLEGLSLNEARTAITNAGFNLGNETSRGNNDGANSSNNGKAKRREDTDSLLDYESIIDFEYYSYVEPVVTPVVVTPVVVTPVVVSPVVVTPVVVTPVVVTPSGPPASTCIPNSASMSSPGWTAIGCGDNGYCDGTAYYERGTCDYYQDYNGTRYYASCSSDYSGPYYQDGSCGYVTPVVVTPVVVTPEVVTPVVVTPCVPTCVDDDAGYRDSNGCFWQYQYDPTCGTTCSARYVGDCDATLAPGYVAPVVNPVVVNPEVVNPVVVTPEVVNPVVVSPVVVTPSCGGTVQLEIYPGAGIYVTCWIQPDCSVEC